MLTLKRAVHAVDFLLGRSVLTDMLPNDGTQAVEQIGALFAVVRDSTCDTCRRDTRISLFNAQTVVVDGVAEGMSSALFSLDGKSVPAEIERNDRQVTFHLNALPQGVYIIRIGQQSFKIIKKS